MWSSLYVFLSAYMEIRGPGSSTRLSPQQDNPRPSLDLEGAGVTLVAKQLADAADAQ